MRTTLIALGLTLAPLLAGAASPRPQDARTWTFEESLPGKLPAGISAELTGPGRPGRWEVLADGAANQILAQLDEDATGGRYPLAVADIAPLRDLRLSVRCKAIRGAVDQACGLVFRYQDPDNYYITRANALEHNIRLYHVKKGKRTQIASWSGKVEPGVWHELRVAALGEHIEVRWNGEPVIYLTDRTFPLAGRVGLWTKADSVTHFDDLTVTPLGAAAK